MHKILCTLLCFFLLAGIMASCRSNSTGPAKKAPGNQFTAIPAVEGFVVKPSALIQTITISGTLKPYEETVLMPEVAGRVVIINLPEGKFVK
jgi:membrane fusion protein (multidrug efflux system)